MIADSRFFYFDVAARRPGVGRPFFRAADPSTMQDVIMSDSFSKILKVE